MRIGVFAPSSPVGQVELELGLERLRAEGFEVVCHPQCSRRHFIYAGSDEERVGAFLELAEDPYIDVLWAARGGYGAARLLPILRGRDRPAKPKLLVGYSDLTVLHEFVRRQWQWATLHAPMPAADLSAIDADDWRATVELVRRIRPSLSYETPCLTFLAAAPRRPVTAELVGGNLSLWASLIGTRDEPEAQGNFLFLEDLSEPFYRIDRMFTQIVQSGGLDGAEGLILGDFTDCRDESHKVLEPPDDDEGWRRLRRDRTGAPRIPLRKTHDEREALDEIFGGAGRSLGIPVASRLPVGHGPNFAPLPLGARYELTPDGALRLIDWTWLK